MNDKKDLDNNIEEFTVKEALSLEIKKQKMKNELATLKSQLSAKIDLDIDNTFIEAFKNLSSKLTVKRVITKKYVEESLASADDSLDAGVRKSAAKWFEFLAVNLEKSIGEWFACLADEMNSSEYVDNTSAHIEKIRILFQSEYVCYIAMDGLKSDVAKEERESELLKYVSNLIVVHPSNLSAIWDTAFFYLNPEYRMKTIKSIWDNHKFYFVKIVKKRMDNMFNSIEKICNDEN